MAYLDRDDHMMLWLAAALREDLPNNSHVHLMAAAEEPEIEVNDAEPSRGYIIHDWFGPFLLGPARRYQRGRC